MIKIKINGIIMAKINVFKIIMVILNKAKLERVKLTVNK